MKERNNLKKISASAKIKNQLTFQLLKGQAFVLICGFLTMLTHVPKLFVTLPLLKKNLDFPKFKFAKSKIGVLYKVVP